LIQDSKFLLVDEFLQLSTNLNIFVDTEHTVTVEVEDDNSKVFEILLTFTVVSGTFTNIYSMNFLDTTGQSMITSLPSADATTEFTISIWYETGTNNRAIGGRWDNVSDCHWYIGFDAARPRYVLFYLLLKYYSLLTYLKFPKKKKTDSG
jgi:hypothetical protein